MSTLTSNRHRECDVKPSRGLMLAAWEVWLANEIKKSVRLYFLPITNPRAAWKMLRAIFRC